MPKVSIVKCDQYDLDKVRAAIQEGLAPFGGIEAIVKPGQKVLCKVNMLLAAAPEKAITTHPVVAQAVAMIVKDAGGVPVIGDSAGGSSYGLSEKALEDCGFKKAAIKAEAETVLFETAGQQEVEVKNGVFLKKLNVSKAVVEADVIINIPKLKTHIETLMTGGVKNMLGALPGSHKLLVHRAAPSPWDLGEALLDIYSALRPQINIMDAVVAMEGNGPSKGKPKQVGAVLVARDAVAMDVVASQIMGLDPMKVTTIKTAKDRRLGENDLQKIKVVGQSIEDVKPATFKTPSNLVMRSIPKPMLRILNDRFFKALPRWKKEGCELCGICVESCPVEAMQMEGDTILINDEECIQCFCCHELCPNDGIKVHKSLLMKILSG